MKIAKLDEDEQSFSKVVTNIEMIGNNTSHFFFDSFCGDVDKKEVKAFNKVKSWKPIYALEDSCFYASEFAYVLTNDKEFAVISHYNAGGSMLDHTKTLMAKDKEQLKEELNKLFAFNGLDPVTDKRVSPRFDFNTLVDSFPNMDSKENVVNVKKPRLK
jgi:hypothetical protein